VTTANTHNAGTVAHDERLAAVNDQAFFSNFVEAIVPENELKPLKPVVIKVETRFWYHFGLLQPNKLFTTKTHPLSKLASRLTGFIYCEYS
jgi:hypothetical protein